MIPHYEIASQKGLKLNANEGLDFLGQDLNRYPHPSPLISYFSDYYQVQKNQIMISPGIDGSLDALFKYARFQRKAVLSFGPTYGLYKILAQQLGVEYREIAPGPLIPMGTIVILCRPNNPTGESWPQKDVWALLKKMDRDSLLYIDEAYADFEEEDSMRGLIGHPQVLVGRTLSKAYGLAGLRVGFSLGAPIEKLRPFLPPYPIPTATVKKIEELIKEDYFFKMRRHFPLIKKTRGELKSVLEPFGRTFDSRANFVALQSEKAHFLFEEGQRNGLLFRFFENHFLLRVSVPEKVDRERVFSFFKKRAL